MVLTASIKSHSYPSTAGFLHRYLHSTFVLHPTNPTSFPQAVCSCLRSEQTPDLGVYMSCLSPEIKFMLMLNPSLKELSALLSPSFWLCWAEVGQSTRAANAEEDQDIRGDRLGGFEEL